MSSRAFTICFFTAAAAAFAQRGFIWPQAGFPGRVVKGAPYSATATTETAQTLGDGNRIHQVTSSNLYRDSAGRTRREQSLNGLGSLAADGNLPQVVFINDPVAGVSYSLDPSSRVAQKTPGRAWEMAGPPPRGPNAAMPPLPGPPGMRGARGPGRSDMDTKTESLGTQTFDGIVAQGTRTTSTIPAGKIGNEQPIQIVSERWYSPDLQLVVMSKQTDPRSGETVYRLSNISRSEPSPAMFSVPSDYKVSEMRSRGNRGPGSQGGASQSQ
jgi:hypothetical protein